ncbi:MAG: TetR/AcrR family transcriptional regulator [Hyphomicrobium sp.]|nr:TetR/AcrR family transcriptional regulator [Hyphomicrobium sp.]
MRSRTGSTPGAERPYHHGNLEAALIEAGLAILRRDGIEALTLRRVAAEAGVSHAAPAHHFGNLRALLSALAAIAFEALDARLTRAREEAGRDAGAIVRSVTAAYLDFALKEPGLFRLMFQAERLDWKDARLARASGRTYAALAAAASALSDEIGITDAAARVEIEQLVWSVSHGYAKLALDRLVPKKGGPRRVAVPDVAGLILSTHAALIRKTN